MSAIKADTSISELLTVVLPRQTKESIKSRGAEGELQGTEITMTLEVSGRSYSYKLINGTQMEVIDDKIDNVMVTISVSEQDLAKMIQNNELDIILMVMTELNKTKYETVRRLSGAFKAELSNDDGSKYNIEVTFNGAKAPTAIFRMKTSDSALMMRKVENPVNLFMAGAMQIEGDMQFSMATQPLFV
jgi:putative sterol carrier protein